MWPAPGLFNYKPAGNRVRDCESGGRAALALHPGPPIATWQPAATHLRLNVDAPNDPPLAGKHDAIAYTHSWHSKRPAVPVSSTAIARSPRVGMRTLMIEGGPASLHPN